MEAATKSREDFASIFKVAAGKIFKDLDTDESLKTQILDVQEILIDEKYFFKNL